MSLVLKDRVRETATVIGTGDAALLGAVTGFQSFSVVGNTNTCYYAIADQSGGDWEVGIGTYSTTGPTLARTTVLASSNSGSKVSFTGGTKDVFLTYPSEKAVYLDASDVLNVVTIDATTLEVTNIKAQDGTAAITLAGSTGVATFAANPIFNAATANGVAYLNGSKVLTTGSALTFDGTNLGVGGTTNYGAGTATATVDASAYSAFTLKVGGVRYGQLYATTSALTLDTWSGTGPIIFSINTGEQMRLTSTGLGIGTSSPYGKLDVNGTIATSASGAASIYFRTSGTINYSWANQYPSAGDFSLYDHGAGATVFTVNSGNLGLGVTPSAWNGMTAFETVGGSVVGYSSAILDVPQNAYFGASGYTYKTSAAASLFRQNASAFKWYIAPSGTAGNAISFTQAMTLDASGNLSLGGTSANGRLDLKMASTNRMYFGDYGGHPCIYTTQSDGSTPDTQNYNAIQHIWYSGSSPTERMRIDSSGNVGIGTSSVAFKLDVRTVVGTQAGFGYGTGFAGIASNTNVATFSGNTSFSTSYTAYATNTAASSLDFSSDGSTRFYNDSGLTSGNAFSRTERMRIDSSGNVGIGTSSPGYKLDIQASPASTANQIFINFNRNTGADSGYGDFMQTGSAAAGAWFGRRYLSYSGFWMAAVTGSNGTVFNTGDIGSETERMRIDSSGNLLVGTTGTSQSGRITASADSASLYPILAQNLNTGSASQIVIDIWRNTTRVGSISNTNTATAYNTSSDYRLKENIQPMQNALGVVQQLKPVTYTWKADGSDGQGFIAHELQAVVPDCVTGEKDAVDAEGKPVYQGIDTSFLVATLTKAIQEQQELINELTARVAQLEGN